MWTSLLAAYYTLKVSSQIGDSQVFVQHILLIINVYYTYLHLSQPCILWLDFFVHISSCLPLALLSTLVLPFWRKSTQAYYPPSLVLVVVRSLYPSDPWHHWEFNVWRFQPQNPSRCHRHADLGTCKSRKKAKWKTQICLRMESGMVNSQ